MLLKHLGLVKLIVVQKDRTIAQGRRPHFSEFAVEKKEINTGLYTDMCDLFL